LDRYFFLKSI